MEQLTNWVKKQLANPQVVILSSLLILGGLVIISMGSMLTPAIAALIIAYLLEGIVSYLVRQGVPRSWSVLLVFSLFIAVLLLTVFGVIPLLSRQVTQLVAQLPTYIQKGREVLLALPEQYPQFVSEQQISSVLDSLGRELGAWGQKLIENSLASLTKLVTVLVYLILVPLLVFFFMKDKEKMAGWIRRHLPRDRQLAGEVWREVDVQIGNYVRGKVVEIIIVGAVSYITFSWFGLQYAALLATIVGLSVLIPYIGATVVTLPVALVAFFQWGWGSDFISLVTAYMIIQALDGNVLVPLLFSEVVDLHPVAIIIAILVFGGFWGFWGVFFAIPLATLVQAILRAWPKAVASENAN